MDLLTQRLLDRFQHGVPVCSRPYQAMADELGCSEQDVLQRLQQLHDMGALSRVGPVMEHSRAGSSSLVALAVPPESIEQVAAYINSLPEVNHNYEREHSYNLWFVLTGPSRSHLDAVLLDIRQHTGLEPLDLPMVKPYRIDLGFPMFQGAEVPQ
ncbi:MAG: Lrp/AsnC family transcriptional regulator [Gammaproteobacteria bacterium]|nr:Lrp/AsnC family transcriptional regulator [Gammaproteobacteria bacterium]